MSVEDVLRDTLRTAPEPPDDLGLPGVARRRAKHLRHRRYASVASAVTCVAVVIAGIALVPSPGRRAGEVTPVGVAPAGAYPDWPRRGDAPASVDAEAVAAYDASLPSGVRRHGTARVLYAGGGTRTVVALHVTATRGGERLVVLHRVGGGFRVYADRAAPEPGARAVAVTLDRRAGQLRDDGDCDPDAATGAEEAFRLLVLSEPARVEARWRGGPDPLCGDVPGVVPASFETVALDRGAALVPVSLAPTAHTEVTVVGTEAARPYYVHQPAEGGYTGVTLGGPRNADLPWTPRADDSRAVTMRDSVTTSPYWEREFDAVGCGPQVAASLPDGTPTTFCVVRADDGDLRTAVLLAEARDRTVRSYAEQPFKPVPSAVAVIVDGFDGRWLVVVGAETLTEAALVDGAERVELAMTNGFGAIPLDREPSRDARVWTPDHAADGGVGIARGPGRVVERG